MPSQQSIADLLGDPSHFYSNTIAKLARLGVEATSFPISHVAYRCTTFRNYLNLRDALETLASANVESVWKGRPISKILLREPLQLSQYVSAEIIELIPPFHKRSNRLGLEHIAFVLGEQLPDFVNQHKELFIDAASMHVMAECYVVQFENKSVAKFLKRSLRALCEQDGHQFDHIARANWRPSNIDAGPFESDQ